MKTILLEQALAKFGIKAPEQYIFDKEDFMTWGNINRFWAKRLGDGFIFGDYDKIRGRIFPGEEASIESGDDFIIDDAIDDVESSFKFKETKSSEEAIDIWNSISFANETHPYLEKNQIKSFGCKQLKDKLVLPLRDTNTKLWNLLFIDENGNEKFLENGKKRCCYFAIGKPQNEKIIICTNFITGAKIHEKTGEAVAIAFDQENLEPVKDALLSKHPNYEINIVADDDIKENASSAGTNEAQDIPEQYNIEDCISISDDSQDKNDNNSLIEQMKTEATKEGVDPIVNATKSEQNIPSEYVLKDDGLFKIDDEKENKLHKVSDKIEILAIARDIESKNWSKVVRFNDPDGNSKTLLIPNNKFLVGTGSELEEILTSEGLYISKPKELKIYINDYKTNNRALCVDKIGWYKTAFVFPDGTVIGNNEDTIMYQGFNRSNEFQINGTLEDWRNYVGKYCQGNSRLILAVSAAFAGTLLYITGQENGGLHFVGNSTIGKSTILNVACSVYGDRSFMKTWRATDNGLEGIAATRNDSLLVLDELGELGDTGKAGEIAYMLGNGNGKIRSHKDGSAKKSYTWRLLYLSSGEIDLSDCATEAKKKIKAGQEIRLLNIPARPSEDSFGVFETVHDKETGKAFSEYLNEVVRNQHGTASRAFIKYLVDDGFKKIANDFKVFLADAEQKYLPNDADNQVKRAFNRFILIAFAGEYASKKGITGWNEKESLNACVRCFNAWIQERGGVKDLEQQKLLEQVRYYLELYSTSRFLDLNGIYRYITNKNGYKRKDEEGTYYFVYPSVFREEICKTFNFKQAKEILFKKGWLKSIKSETQHFRGEKERVYTLTPKIWSDEDVNE